MDISTSTRPVVVGLDRSPHATAALEHATALAERRHLPLLLVNAYEPSQFDVRSTAGWSPDAAGVPRNVAERLVDDAVDTLRAFHPAVEVRTKVEAGSAVQLLIEESTRASAIVLGSRGTGGFAELLLGSTTLHLASHATCPVIAVPAPDPTHPAGRGIVVGVDGSALSDSAMEYSFAEAADLGEPLVAVHAWHDVTRTGVGRMMPLAFDPVEVADEQRLLLTESLAAWRDKFPDVEVAPKVVYGHPVPALLRYAGKARLLVVGCRGRGSVRSLLLGSVSHGVLHHATGAVAVVHSGC